jgi:hypothetical protein
MRIYNHDEDSTCDNVTIYLTNMEAKELYDDLASLMEQPLNNHAHISSEDHQREVTICIYDKDKLDGFDDRSKEILST